MKQTTELIWRRTGWSQVIAIGVLAGVFLALLSLSQGFRKGYDVGLQALETGQAQLESLRGGIGPYFMVRALAEQNRDVLVTSARLDFTARLEGPSGLTTEIKVRACNFSQEDLVTGILKRIVPVRNYLTSGIVLSYNLSQDPRWQGLTTLTLSSPTGEFEPRRVPISGRVATALGPSFDDQSFIDLETARSLWGGSTPVSSIVLRLRPRVEAQTWVNANQKTFSPLGLQLLSWKEVSTSGFRDRSVVLGPLSFFLNALAAIAAAGILLVGLAGRSPRSGLSLLLRTGRENWGRALGLLTLSVGATDLFLLVVEPLYQNLLLGNLKGAFPFLSAPDLLWSWDPGLLLWPTAVVAIAAALFWVPLPTRFRPRRVKAKKPRTEP